jgi:acetolactate synthase II small subunit
MTDRIEIEFRPSEGAILRLIGLVERRGFEVRGVDLPADADRWRTRAWT